MVTKKPKTFKIMARNLKAAQGKTVEVGIFGDSVARRSANGSKGDNLALRYKFNDQGANGNWGRIPARPTLNPGIELALASDPFAKTFAAKKLDESRYKDQFKTFGEICANSVKKAIRDLKSPPKSPVTIAVAKRRHGVILRDPLLQTGEMHDAVEARIK